MWMLYGHFPLVELYVGCQQSPSHSVIFLAIGAFLWDIVSRGCSSSHEFTPLGILIGVKSWVEQYSYVPRDFSSTKMFHSH